jgi:type I restriction-modification system DNA methylase subunit
VVETLYTRPYIAVADLLRGDDKQSEYGRVVLPFAALRRLDGVLAPLKDDVLDQHDQVQVLPRAGRWPLVRCCCRW